MTSPLFEAIPGAASLPLAQVTTLPTPVSALDATALGGRLTRAASILVKRDDLTSSHYGGNKARKLDFLLGKAIAEKNGAVLTFGAYGSNHALATAVHALRLGIEPHVVLSPQEPGPYARATVLAHAGLGTVIHPAAGWDSSREAVAARTSIRERSGVEPLVIPGGGTNALGLLGYVNAALELIEQAERGEISVPDVVYVAAGTLGTAVGLALGFALAGVDTAVEAIRVTPIEICSDAHVERFTNEAVALLRSLDATVPDITAADLRFVLRHDHFEPGYGVVTDATTEAVARAAAVGVGLETTYTGKVFSAMLCDAEDGRFDGCDVLFWNTYNSAPLPAPGPIEVLPEPLQDYVRECERRFGVPTVTERTAT